MLQLANQSKFMENLTAEYLHLFPPLEAGDNLIHIEHNDLVVCLVPLLPLY